MVLCILLDNLPVAHALCQVLQHHLCDVRRQNSERPALPWRRLPPILQACKLGSLLPLLLVFPLFLTSLAPGSLFFRGGNL